MKRCISSKAAAASTLLVLGQLLVFLLPAVAQTINDHQQTTHHLPLWKVEGITNSVYLLGSMHLLKESHYPLPSPMESAFSNAQVVVFETNFDDLTRMDTYTNFMRKCLLPSNETLKDRLSADTYSQLMDFAEKSGGLKKIPKEALIKMKPYIAAMSLLDTGAAKLGLKPELGLDDYFYELAKKRSKKIITLDSVDSVNDIWTNFPKEDEESVVKAMLKDINAAQKNMSAIVEAWETGDAPQTEKLLKDFNYNSPVLIKRMLTDRNERWLPKICDVIRSGNNAIIIVGHGHFVGDKGLLQLLGTKNFKVTQL